MFGIPKFGVIIQLFWKYLKQKTSSVRNLISVFFFGFRQKCTSIAVWRYCEQRVISFDLLAVYLFATSPFLSKIIFFLYFMEVDHFRNSTARGNITNNIEDFLTNLRAVMSYMEENYTPSRKRRIFLIAFHQCCCFVP